MTKYISIKLTVKKAQKVDDLLFNLGIQEIDERSIITEKNKELIYLRAKINDELEKQNDK